MKKWLPQLLRRALQLGALAFIVYTAFGSVWRNHKLAHNSERLVALIHGELWGFLYGTNEDALELFGESYQSSTLFLGFPWASRFLGVDLADPLLALGQLIRTGELHPSLLLGLIVPLGLAFVAGKFFCSHLCPMRTLFELGQSVRAGLCRLRVSLPSLRSEARFGGFVLLGGCLAVALSSTAIWLFILPYVSVGAGIFLLVTTGTATAFFAVVAFWFVVDVTVAPGFFCYNLCPTGFLLEQTGRFSVFRLIKRGEEPCPTGCSLCIRTCPYGLSARDRTHAPACDGCGRCAVVCPSQRLKRGLDLGIRRLPVLSSALAAGLLLLSTSALAHHNKGLPHYGYYENYPQVPTDEYIAIEGRWEIGATFFNFQGMERRDSDTPNDVKIFVYLYDLEKDEGYSGPLVVEIRLDGKRISRFDRLEIDEESVYSTRETLPQSGTYELVAIVEGEEVVLPFYIDLASGEIDWTLIAAIVVPVLGLFGLAAYGRKRRRKRKKPPAARVSPTKSSTAKGGISALVLLGLLGLSEPAFAQQVDEGAASAEVSVSTTDSANRSTCPHCGMWNCTMDHSDAAGGNGSHSAMEHYETDEGMVMVMGGMPLWMFILSIIGILIFSFVATEWIAPKSKVGFRKNLLKSRRVYRWVRSRWFQAVPQLLLAAALVFLVYAGLRGSRVTNITPIAVWTLWWAGLVFSVLLLASAWCFVCPWDGLANLLTRFNLRKRVEPLSLRLPYPRALKNMYPAIALFVLLTWFELGWGVTTNPRSTAYMGLGMAALAVASVLLWGGKEFCAHICPVGRICGIYSNVAPLEIRARKAKTCEVCTTEDCLHGKDPGYPCPTGISLKTVDDATMCTMCTECVKSCDKQNVAINFRPFGVDLTRIRPPKADEAWLAIILLSLTLFHGLSMTSAWENFRPGSTSLLKWLSTTLGTPKVFNFTIAMIIVCAIPVALYALGAWLTARWTRADIGPKEVFLHFAYSILPVALFYHLAHNLMHLLMEGGEIVPRLSDPLGHGDDFFGTADIHVGSLISDQTLWVAQVALILVGHVAGIVVAHRVAHRLCDSKEKATKSLLPMLGVMILLSVAGLSLMHIDMNMRMGRM